MLIKARNSSTLKDCDVTDESIYQDRRSVLKQLGFLGAGALIGSVSTNKASAGFFSDDEIAFRTKALSFSKDNKNIGLQKTPEQKVISHNNFYEFEGEINSKEHRIFEQFILKNNTQQVKHYF